MKSAVAIFACWATIAIGGMWHFMYRYALPAAPASTITDVAPHEILSASNGKQVELGAGNGITLIDFTSGDCGCSQFIKKHVQALESTYGKQGVRFVHVIESEEQTPVGGLNVKDPHGVVAKRFGVGATPGAVIVDSKGHIAFSGAYNRARFCDAHETAFAEIALKAILAGTRPALERTPFYGCAVPL